MTTDTEILKAILDYIKSIDLRLKAMGDPAKEIVVSQWDEEDEIEDNDAVDDPCGKSEERTDVTIIGGYRSGVAEIRLPEEWSKVFSAND